MHTLHVRPVTVLLVGTAVQQETMEPTRLKVQQLQELEPRFPEDGGQLQRAHEAGWDV